MWVTEHWNYNGIKFIEFYGLRRSGNHAIIAWLMKNLSSYDAELESLIAPVPELGFISKKCGDVYHLNDVGSGWSAGNPQYLAGLIDAYVSMGAKTIIISYEDYAPDASLLHTFPKIFGFLQNSKKIVLIRDIVNVASSRYKAQQKIGPEKVSFGINVDKINAWLKSVISDEFKIKYENWLSSKEYRDSICNSLGIVNRDVTSHVSNAGGGSSFNGILPVNKDRLLNRYKEVDLPKDWIFYLETVEVIRARKTAGYIKPSENAIHFKIIGDSHTAIFDGYTGSDYYFEQIRVHGATARGSANPKTKTNSLEQFRNGLSGKKANRVVIGLGEVDCGYLIWYRNKHNNISIEQAMNESMDGMFTFIQNEVRPIYEPHEIILMSVIPPIIEDNTNPNFLQGRRADVNPTIDERFELTEKWNLELSKRCEDLGFTYIDFNSKILDENNRVKKEYRSVDPWNHHLREYNTMLVVLEEIKKLEI